MAARPPTSIAAVLKRRASVTLASIPDGMTGRVLGEIAAGTGGRVVFVARDGQRLAEVERTIRFFAPNVAILDFPAWDCLPYDRASPNTGVVARRMATLAALQAPTGAPQIVLTTVNAVLQRVPDREFVAGGSLSLAGGAVSPMDRIVRWLERNGYLRSATVREPGEYAVRGGILDLFPPGEEEPVRLDFFGDSLETIRSFDPETQRSTTARPRIDLVPANEMLLTPETIARFRERYVALFGAAQRDDLLYQSVSEGRRYVGMEHWLPLFSEGLETLFDHVGEAPLVLDHLADEAIAERIAQVKDHYEARVQVMDGEGMRSSVPYKPLRPENLYLLGDEWTERLGLDAAGAHLAVRGAGGLRRRGHGRARGTDIRGRAQRRRRQRLRCRDPPCGGAPEAGQARTRRRLERGFARPHRPGPGRSRAHAPEARCLLAGGGGAAAGHCRAGRPRP